MDTPSFHAPQVPPIGQDLVLSEESSKHAIAVLRMREGDRLRLVDGRGTSALAEIRDGHRKRCAVQVLESHSLSDTRHPLTLGVSLLKNPARFEWMLEKACEIGVRRVVPLILQRTERQRHRQDRLEAVALSALLQSQQAWMTEVEPPTDLDTLLAGAAAGERLIAHCLPGVPAEDLGPMRGETMMLVGPEGDFTESEVARALSNGFRAVRLGPSRLRSETAGVVAAAVLCIASRGHS